jgi:hypothetical protein
VARILFVVLLLIVPPVDVRLKMKLIKMALVIATFLFSTEAAHAVGKMEKDEMREGQLVCASGQPLKVAPKNHDGRKRQEQASVPANAESAL